MNLQKILFPNVCNETELYFRGSKFKYSTSQEISSLIIQENGKVSLSTYFNSFSWEKWKKYTQINNISIQLELSGRFEIRLISNKLKSESSGILSEVVYSKVVDTNKKTIFEFPFKTSNNEGILFVEIVSLKNGGIFYGGWYTSSINYNHIRDIKIALAICTFKREEYLFRNIRYIKENIINNKDAILYDKLSIYISDNGQTLQHEQLQEKHIKVFSNLNCGGAGGFTRCMIEAIYRTKESKFDYIIIMDDDILIDYNVLERNYVFLQLLKSEFKDSMIGGAMLREDAMYLQHASTEYWSPKYSKALKQNLDLRKLKNVLHNEREEPGNYNGWWYCCIPTSIISENNLPIPIFIHYDDIEYGVRNKRDIISLNGIAVWHPKIQNKGSNMLIYYNTRNLLIVQALHAPNISLEKVKHDLFVYVFGRLIRYRYVEAKLCLKGYEDFFAGVDFLKNENAFLLHKEITKNEYERIIIPENISDEVKSALEGNKELRKEKFQMLGLLNWFVPSFGRTKYINVDCRTNNSFFSKNLFVIDTERNTYYKLSKSYKELWNCIRHYFKVRRLLINKYETTSNDWRSRIEELSSMNFWKKYLNID